MTIYPYNWNVLNRLYSIQRASDLKQKKNSSSVKQQTFDWKFRSTANMYVRSLLSFLLLHGISCQRMHIPELGNLNDGAARLLRGYNYARASDVTGEELHRQTAQEIVASLDWLHNVQVRDVCDQHIFLEHTGSLLAW